MKFLALFRELVGWLLLGSGMVVLFFAGYKVIAEHSACSGLVLAGIGYVVLRGGLHLIKIGVAARAAADGRSAVLLAISPRVVRKPVVAKASLAAPKADVLPGPKSKPR